MQELEKILEEIDQNQVMLKPFDEEDRPTGIINVDVVKGIIRKHMNDGNCGECSRRKWYLKGYEDGKKSNEDWIPVHKDNVPDHEILACDKYGNELIGYLDYDSEVEEFVCESNDVIMYQIIAWMEKPEPYRPERNRP